MKSGSKSMRLEIEVITFPGIAYRVSIVSNGEEIETGIFVYGCPVNGGSGGICSKSNDDAVSPIMETVRSGGDLENIWRREKGLQRGGLP